MKKFAYLCSRKRITIPTCQFEDINFPYLYVSSPEDYAAYEKYFVDQLPYTEDELKAMKAENKRLQEALELEKLRSRAYDTMIDVAEANFNIPIRKKAGTKQ